MLQLASTLLTLAATTAHHRRFGFVGIIVLVVIIGVAYYAWRQRALRMRAERDRR